MNAEQKARELLAEVERGPVCDYGTVHRRIAHEAIARALEQREGWRPIESAPVSDDYLKEATKFLAYWPDGRIEVVVSRWRTFGGIPQVRLDVDFGDTCIQHHMPEDYQPTYWMPLPAAPKPEDAS